MNTCTTPAETRQDSRLQSVQRPRFRSTEDDQGAILEVALPGVRKEDLKLTLHESNLRIEATRSDAVPGDWKTHRDEIQGAYGLDIRLTRRFDGTKATASLNAGVLTLKVPLREEAKPRQIAVN